MHAKSCKTLPDTGLPKAARNDAGKKTLTAEKKANIGMDFPIRPQRDNRQPMPLLLLTDTTAPLFYKIIVSFSVAIEFF